MSLLIDITAESASNFNKNSFYFFKTDIIFGTKEYLFKLQLFISTSPNYVDKYLGLSSQVSNGCN